MKRKILISFLIFVVALVCAHTLWNWRTGVALRRVIDEASRLGIPMEMEDIIMPSVPKDQNAAPLLTQAFVLMAGGSTNFSEYDPKIEALLEHMYDLDNDSTLIPDLTTSLADPEVLQILTLIHQAAQRPKCHWRLDYTKGLELEFPHIASNYKAVSLLCLKALTQARNGQAEIGFRTLVDSIRLVNHSVAEPLFISYLFWIGQINIIEATMSRVVELSSPDQFSVSTLLDLRKQCATLRSQAGELLGRSYDAERILYGGLVFGQLMEGSLSLDAFVEIGALSADNDKTRFFTWFLMLPIFDPVHKVDYRVYLESLLSLRESALLPIPEAVSVEHMVDTLPRFSFLSQLMIPQLGLGQERRGIIEARMAVAEVGLSLEVYRVTNGRYPDTLIELGNNHPIPQDPFTGESLIYSGNVDGFVLYSLGPNQMDDKGGLERDEGINYDIVWKINRKLESKPSTDAEQEKTL